MPSDFLSNLIRLLQVRFPKFCKNLQIGQLIVGKLNLPYLAILRSGHSRREAAVKLITQFVNRVGL